MATAHQPQQEKTAGPAVAPAKSADTTSKPKKSDGLGTGGYTDKPWFLRIWDGMPSHVWFPLLLRNRLHISPRRWGMAVLISFISLINLFLALLQTLVYGRRIARTQLQGDPIFVIGHWRSGTTLLHELLVLDERHTYSNTYDCFASSHFLVSAAVFRPLVRGLLPKQRPMDNMAAGWDYPQEDEFALVNIGVRSPYFTIAFPNHPPQDQEYFELKDVSPQQRTRWQRGLIWFLKCLTVRSPRRIVLKSPPHTFRVKILLEMFPKARFIHIVRNPFVLFPSTINLWKRMYRNDGLQMPRYDSLDEHVFSTLVRMYETFERDRSLIPPGQLCEVRYEDLVARPLEQMERVYDELKLDEFDEVRSQIEGYFAAKADYKTNRYQLPPELAAEIARRWAAYFDRYGYSKEQS
jgi:omega-hydroxy-beta-dihydromenaquinone-9 sulfotransferase